MIKRIAWVFIFLFYACELPFDTSPSKDGSSFELTIEHSITRLVDSAVVELTWEEISLENFSRLTIERRTTDDTAWALRATLANPLFTSYQDTVNDDKDLRYRVSIVDIQGNAKWAEGKANIPKTTSLFVPADYTSIQEAFESRITDDGDSILVAPGRYVGSLSILGKHVLIQSTNGYEETTVVASDRQRCINISAGILDGFRLEGGLATRGPGGGVYASGTATLRRNFISGNHTSRVGGGVFLTGNVNLYNNIILDNMSDFGSGGIYASNATGQVINNTIVYNGSDGVVVSRGAITFLNNIVIAHKNSDIVLADSIAMVSSEVDYSLFKEADSVGGGNISGNPQFINPDLEDFHLEPDSPCIDAGHPGDEYLDRDGSRNDMGAYGGPYGE